LFDLYQIGGRRQDFEHLAAEYVVRFETSPPLWVEAMPEAPAKSKLANQSSVVLSGVLNAQSEEMLKQVYKLAETSSSILLEFGKLTDVDDQGCGLLNAVRKHLKAAHKGCVLGGLDKLAVLVAKKTVVGERRNEQAWLLLLAIYQQLGKQGAFDDVAVNYAVTFEVSPPAFEMPEDIQLFKIKPEPEVDTGAEIKEANCVLEGVITAASESSLSKIRAEAMLMPEVVVDVAQLQRMDFIAATNLMNMAAELMAVQKKVRLIKASHLLTALWELIGLDRVVRIETRKI
jgi:anti-anti-sigma regulatory factor